MKYLVLLLSIASLSIIGCKPEAKPIEYGKQACDYCRMSIVDEQYAAQLVNSKGKAYSFDAIECMINYKHEHQQEWAHELVTDYNTPRKLINASECWIVRSKKLPSPMGMFLTALPTQAEAKALQDQHGGQIYPYIEVSDDLNNLPAL